MLCNLTWTKREYNSSFVFSGLCLTLGPVLYHADTEDRKHIDLAGANNMFAIHGNAFKDDILITPLSCRFI